MTMRFQSAKADISPVQRVDLRDLALSSAQTAIGTVRATPVAVAFGDGVGPELMFASLRVLFAAGARISVDSIDLEPGARRSKCETGLAALETVRRNKVLLKGPLQLEPGSEPPLDAQLARVLPLCVSVRPYRAHALSRTSLYPAHGVVIVHDVGDPAEGMEYRQSEWLHYRRPFVNHMRCETIIRGAFDYAVRHGRSRIACVLDNRRPGPSDAMVRALFNQIGARHGGIVREHWSLAAAAARLISEPECFDVIVAPASGGHVLSAVAQEVASAVGVAHAAHFGPSCAVFEASHGPLHALAGKDRANPSALILAGAMMLDHIGQHDVAERLQKAWLRTVEDGIRTFDMNTDGSSGDDVGTAAFSSAVIDRLGREPLFLTPVRAGRHGMRDP